MNRPRKRKLTNLFRKLVRRLGSQRLAAGIAGVSTCIVSQVVRGIYPAWKSLLTDIGPRVEELARQCAAPDIDRGFRTDHDRIWYSMRLMRQFTYPDLSITADVSYDCARNYLSCLRRAGYVALIARHGNKPGQWAQYRLVRNTGPKVPRLVSRKSAVFDPNTRERIEVRANAA